MDLRDVKPAKDYAQNFGIKSIIYGPPGSGKTPLVQTAPRPILLACEAGLLSMRNSMVPTIQAFTAKRIDEFFEWFLNSNDNKNYDTLAIDSGSHMAEIYLDEALTGKSKAGNKVHGQVAYGQMATDTLKHLNKIYTMPYKHVYLIAKENNKDGYRKPYFPGDKINSEIPHLYDFILHLAIQNIPGVGQKLAFRCNQAIDVLARSRTGNLADFEYPDYAALVRKAMET